MDKKIGLGKDVFTFLNIPKCPKKEWDGKEEFAFRVAVVHRVIGTEEYAVCTFNPSKDEKPRIIKDYEANYIVFDIRNGGEVHYNTLTSTFEHPYRKYDDWNNHGFTVCPNNNIQMISTEKMNDLVSRTVDKEAIPCLIPINASASFNSVMWQELNHKLKNGELRFLVDLIDYQKTMGVEELNMTSEERVDMQLPYVQTRLLINEAVNLTATYKTNGEVALSEGTNPNATKDRIVALGYGNMIMSKIINQLNISRQQSAIDVSQYQLIF